MIIRSSDGSSDRSGGTQGELVSRGKASEVGLSAYDMYRQAMDGGNDGGPMPEHPVHKVVAVVNPLRALPGKWTITVLSIRKHYSGCDHQHRSSHKIYRRCRENQ